jgi:hypothetical protein
MRIFHNHLVGGRYRVIEAGATKDGATIARTYRLPGYCTPR